MGGRYIVEWGPRGVYGERERERERERMLKGVAKYCNLTE
jgi:hypothetical protein